MLRYLVLLLFVSLACNNSPENKSASQAFEDIHSQAILVDTHNDILSITMEKDFIMDTDLTGKTHSDLERMKTGGLDAQFFSVWSSGEQSEPFKFANRQIDNLDAVIKRNPDKITRVANTNELLATVQQNKIAALIGVEGGHHIENDLDHLDALFNRGVRYMSLTWNNSTDWATSASDETENKELDPKGLSDFGKQVIARMNTLGMLVDVSHSGEQTFRDVIATSTKPIIASHSSVYSLCPHPRNLKDDQIKAIAKNGGVIQINFNSGFIDPTSEKKEADFVLKHKAELDALTESGMDPYNATEFLFAKYAEESEQIKAPFDLVIEHIEYVINLVGVDYVGIGSDFDGILLPPQQLDDVTTYPLITKALLEKGYSEQDINKILGGNILRVLKANESE